MLVELTKNEISLIETALNHYWHDANDQLSNNGAIILMTKRRPLGDIEKELLEQRRELVKPLLMSLKNL